MSSRARPLSGFQPSATARVEYVVAELSGRWTSDRSWLSPRAHAAVNPSIHLDNHTQAPQQHHHHYQRQSSSSSSKAFSADNYLLSSPRRLSKQQQQQQNAREDPTLGPFTWSAALADANAVGGGGRPGHSGILFRSHPLLVCQQEQIPSGSQVSFCIEAILPDDIPPSFKGSAMRYGYALVVVVKLPDTAVPHVVRVPFRVLPAMHALHSSIDAHGREQSNGAAASTTGVVKTRAKRIPVPTPRDVGPRPNRFLQHEDISPLRMSARLLKSTPPDDIETALALSMNGRLTDYRANVEHRQLMNDHPLDYPHVGVAGTPSAGTALAGAGMQLSSTFSAMTPHLSSSHGTPLSTVHYLPSMSSSSALTSSTLGGGSGIAMPWSSSQYDSDHLYDPSDSSSAMLQPPATPPLRVYAITRGTQPVAKVYLAKRVHHLGHSMQIMFDFHRDRPCYRIGAKLEMHEVVGARYAVGYQDVTINHDNSKNGNYYNNSSGTLGRNNNMRYSNSAALSTDMAIAPVTALSASDSAISEQGVLWSGDGNRDGRNGGDDDQEEADGVTFRKVFGDYAEFVMAARNTEVTFSIPHDAPPSFSTGVVTVRWMLHFTFVIPKEDKQQPEQDTRRSHVGNNTNQSKGGDANELSTTQVIDNDDDGDDDALRETEQLLDGLSLQQDGIAINGHFSSANGVSGEAESMKTKEAVDDGGWVGGKWKGEDPKTWEHIPDSEVDTLRWTLPIVVSGQPGSPWGVRNVNRISHVHVPAESD